MKRLKRLMPKGQRKQERNVRRRVGKAKREWEENRVSSERGEKKEKHAVKGVRRGLKALKEIKDISLVLIF